MSKSTANLRYLIDAVLDGRATGEDIRELEQLALADPAVLRTYVDAVNLHTSLQWDYGNAREEAPRQTSLDPLTRVRRQSVSLGKSALGVLSGVALALLVGVIVFFRPPSGDVIANNNGVAGDGVTNSGIIKTEVTVTGDAPVVVSMGDNQPASSGAGDSPAAVLATTVLEGSPNPGANTPPAVVAVNPDAMKPSVASTVDATGSKPDREPAFVLASFIDEKLTNRWDDEGLTPSGRAEPTEWLRRASLDLKGRIPTRGEIASFLGDSEIDRRGTFVADALASGEYARHFATVWSNLLVGRSSKRAKHRERLQDYLDDSFAQNRSWGDVAGELVSAEGTEDHAPTNFLLAHLNNEAVPATAITSRVLLGRQVQCTQCHNHPFNDWKQDEFWQLNAFFQQCRIENRPGTDGKPVRALVDRSVGGPTFFENRRGLMKVAYPIYEGERVPEAPSVHRRQELAKLIVSGETNDLAVAMVNRVWSHFLGAGFTRDIEDIGPHAAVSHPELLDRMAREFVASGYDMKQLVTWVTGSAAYQLSNEVTDGNEFDRPEIGETPAFSRVYEKPLSPEQLYDSLVTAAVGPRRSVPGLPSRSEWVAEFYAAQENEENTEMSTFEASPSVALELMNGYLISKLVSSPGASALTDVLELKAPEDERLDALCQLVLGRDALGPERKTLLKVLRPTIAAYSRELPRDDAVREGYRDLFWAYVNSSEFAVNR